MYIVSPAWPSPGIEPRTPTVLGWSAGLHTSIVAHSWRDCSSARLLVCGLRRRGPAPSPRRRRAERAQADSSATSAASGEAVERFSEAMLLKIAPGARPGAPLRCIGM